MQTVQQKWRMPSANWMMWKTYLSISFMTTKMVLKADEDKMDAVIAESEKIIKKIEPDVVMKPKA